MKRHSIGKAKAIELYESNWWVGLDSHSVVQIQLFTKELCMPFGKFHAAVEEVLGRPVFTHEFGVVDDGIVSECLGEKEPPTMYEIIELIPEEKRIILLV